MLVSFEGPSFSGKSTILRQVYKGLKEINDINVIMMKGPGQINFPGEDSWKEYNHYMHAVLHRLDKLNDDLIILGDRSFTEAVVTEDRELLRRYKCYEEKYVVYCTASEEVLTERGTLTEDTELTKQRYEKLLATMESVQINTGILSTTDAVNLATTEIIHWYNEGEKDFYEEEQQ